MKRHTFYLLTTAAIMATLFAACGKEKIVAVTDLTLDRIITTRAVGSTFSLTATVAPDNATNKTLMWTSSNTTAATVKNGSVTSTFPGIATIRVSTTDDSNKAASCFLTVASGLNNRTPKWGAALGEVSFVSDNTWTVGDQIWSDAVVATACKKNEYSSDDSESYVADCRQNPGYGDLFSWGAVILFQDQLCPNGWRVPNREDFIALDKALGGTGNSHSDVAILSRYMDVDVWNGACGGYCINSGAIHLQNERAYYWSATENNSIFSYYLCLINNDYGVHPQGHDSKGYGFTLRCVRDK